MNNLGFQDRKLPDRSLPRLAYSVSEVCHIIGCKESFLRQQIREGRLKAVRVGEKKLFILATAIEAFLAGGDDPALVRAAEINHELTA